MRVALRSRALSWALALGLLAGCAGDSIVPPSGDEPFVYIILGQRTVNHRALGPKYGQHGYLLRSGSPAEPAIFLEADRFDMLRARDRARFGWRSFGFKGEATGTWAVSYDDANYNLPDTATMAGLGAEDIQPGERYELEIEVGGALILGSVVVPDSFTVTVTELNGRTVATWPDVAGAAGYQVHFADEDAVLLTDTLFGLPADAIGSGGALAVEAMDPNLWLYITNDQTPRAGIEGALGLFGALTTAMDTL